MKEAIKALEQFIKDLLAKDDPNTEVNVYAGESEKHGVRIGEISIMTKYERGAGGCSWMRSDPEAGAVILNAEEFLLTYGQKPEPWDDSPDCEDFWDFHGEAKWRLEFLLTEKPVDTNQGVL
jgi:hypothetical protein